MALAITAASSLALNIGFVSARPRSLPRTAIASDKCRAW